MPQEFSITRSATRSPAKVADLKKVLKALQTAYSRQVDLVEVLASIGKARRATYEDPDFRTAYTQAPDLSPYLLHTPVELWTTVTASACEPLDVVQQFAAASRISFSRGLRVSPSGKKPEFVVGTRYAASNKDFHFAVCIRLFQEDIPDYWPVKDHPEFWSVVADWCNEHLWPALGFGGEITTSVVAKPVFRLQHTSSQRFRDDPSVKLQGKGDPYHEFALLVDNFERAKELFDSASSIGVHQDTLSLLLRFPDKKTYTLQRKLLKEFSSDWSCRARTTFEKSKDPFQHPSRIVAGDPPQWTVASTLYGGESFINIVHEREGSFLEFCSNQPRETVERLWAETGEAVEWCTGEPAARWSESL
ncbi:MAG: hypothetical protein KDA91_25095 [Planctomycetaceae bacterium]|nr:hypothetical protein [Planctomycetaceae bacterium]